MKRFAQVTGRAKGVVVAMTSRISERSRREQVLLALGLGLALAFGLARWVWQPMQAARAELLTSIARNDQTLAVLGRLPLPDADSASADIRPVAEIVTDSAADYQMVIRRLQASADAADLVLEDAAFDGLILWLDALEAEQGLRIQAIDLTRRPGPGMVSVRLTVARWQS